MVSVIFLTWLSWSAQSIEAASTQRLIRRKEPNVLTDSAGSVRTQEERRVPEGIVPIRFVNEKTHAHHQNVEARYELNADGKIAAEMMQVVREMCETGKSFKNHTRMKSKSGAIMKHHCMSFLRCQEWCTTVQCTGVSWWSQTGLCNLHNISSDSVSLDMFLQQVRTSQDGVSGGPSCVLPAGVAGPDQNCKDGIDLAESESNKDDPDEDNPGEDESNEDDSGEDESNEDDSGEDESEDTNATSNTTPIPTPGEDESRFPDTNAAPTISPIPTPIPTAPDLPQNVNPCTVNKTFQAQGKTHAKRNWKKSGECQTFAYCQQSCLNKGMHQFEWEPWRGGCKCWSAKSKITTRKTQVINPRDGRRRAYLVGPVGCIRPDSLGSSFADSMVKHPDSRYSDGGNRAMTGCNKAFGIDTDMGMPSDGNRCNTYMSFKARDTSQFNWFTKCEATECQDKCKDCQNNTEGCGFECTHFDWLPRLGRCLIFSDGDSETTNGPGVSGPPSCDMPNGSEFTSGFVPNSATQRRRCYQEHRRRH